MSDVLAVDAGRTTCRAAVVSDGVVAAEIAVPAFGTMLDPGGVDAVHDAIVNAVAHLDDAADGCGHLVAGVAGTWAAGPGTATLAERVAATLGCERVMVTNDVVCAFAGAFGVRGQGVLLAVGTGALALAVGPSGTVRVDGWGHVLGDAGSGHWLGREGLRAAVAAHDGRARPTALTRRAIEQFGDLDQLPNAIAGAPEPARTVAAFCEAVLGAAADGDPVAEELVSAAVDALATTAATAVRRSHPRGGPVDVAIVGGLADRWLRLPLYEAIVERVPGASVRGGGAGALVGAASLTSEDGSWSALTATWNRGKAGVPPF